MAQFKCKMCGGTLEINGNETVGTCEYCGTQQTLPKLDDDRKANLYDRANHFRRSNEFDKAMGMYERILNEDTTDAEAYWSLVLCRYGIEYVEDPATHKRIPTVNRAQYTSIFDDDNYKLALQYADGYQRHIYEEEAKAINEIQKGILAISQKEEPFDVFICYKETDRNGRRTPDSVLANDLYHQLTQEGFKVFFSRITLEDKLGVAYEPYIFAALNSAKVMVVVGTKPEYFNAVWVKNEWSRYLSLIRGGAKKVLIPAYRDMDPYDLPEEFSHLQAQDMGKLGFMQDLIRGIKKLTKTEEPKATTVVKETIIAGTAAGNTAPLLKRAFMFLEDGEWESADEYCEKVLDIDPENALAYLGKLMAELNVCKQEELRDQKEPFDEYNNYLKAIRFADTALKEELKGYISYINDRNEQERLENAYNYSKRLMTNASTEDAYKKAARSFETIPDYKDSAALAQECYLLAEDARKDAILAKGKAKMEEYTISDFEAAIALFRTISGWKDADEKCYKCQKEIEELKAAEEADRLERERKAEADRLERERLAKIRAKRNKTIAIVASAVAVIAVAVTLLLNMVILPSSNYKKAEELLAAGDNAGAAMAFGAAGDWQDARERSFELWDQIAQRKTFDTSNKSAVAIRNDGTVVTHNGEKDWTDIIAVAAGEKHIVGLRSDGTVVASGNNEYGQCDVSSWRDIVAISVGSATTMGLRSDGTVVYTNDPPILQGWPKSLKDVNDWTDIVTIYVDYTFALGIRRDGTVVTNDSSYDFSNWTDIVAISSDYDLTAGLRSDGTVILYNDDNSDVNKWKDIEAISSAYQYIVGLRKDGTVLIDSDDLSYHDASNHMKDKISSWTDIVAINANTFYTAGLRSDGTVVVACEENHDCSQYHNSISSWTDIKIPSDREDMVAAIQEKQALELETQNSEQYAQAEALLAEGKTAEAAMAFYAIGNYQDARERSFALWAEIRKPETISVGWYHTVGLCNDGTVVATGDNEAGQCDVSSWTNIVAISTGPKSTVGLRSDGTVVAAGQIAGSEFGEWTDIVAISANDDYVVGLRIDGSVVATFEDIGFGDWTDIVAISAGGGHIVGLRGDGTVVAVGANGEGQCNVGNWKNIVAISAGDAHTVGLRSDGTLVAVGDDWGGMCDVGSWTDIVAVSAGYSNTTALRSDGTVLVTNYGQDETSKWTDIVAISSDHHLTAGIRSDGTVVAVSDLTNAYGESIANVYGECNVSGWKNIRLPD